MLSHTKSNNLFSCKQTSKTKLPHIICRDFINVADISVCTYLFQMLNTNNVNNAKNKVEKGRQLYLQAENLVPNFV